MSKQVQCNRCGYIFDSEEEGFGYCPLCENDQVEIDTIENKPIEEQLAIYKKALELCCQRYNNDLEYYERGIYSKTPEELMSNFIEQAEEYKE